MNEQQTPQTTQQPIKRKPVMKNPLIITIAAVGGLVLLGAGVSEALRTTHMVTAYPSALSGPADTNDNFIDTSDITSVSLDIGAAEVTLQFENVDEMTMVTEGLDRSAWVMDRSGGELTVASPQGRNVSLIRPGAPNSATITLPERMRGVDLDIELAAGTVTAAGEFGELDVDVSAGEVVVSGAAKQLDVDISAGSVIANLNDVRKASFDVAAGDGKVVLGGSAPETLTADVSVGSLTIELPDTTYRITKSVELGSLESSLREDKAAASQIEATVELGSLVMKPTATPAR